MDQLPPLLAGQVTTLQVECQDVFRFCLVNAEFLARFDAMVAEGVLDRLVNSSYHLAVEGRSYWPEKRPGLAARACKRR